MSGRHTAVVAQHYNQLEEKGLEARSKSRIFHLRNFNNWIKSMLISEILERYKKEKKPSKISVLDLGAGKGGDLMKWKKNGIHHLVCTDIAETSVQQSQQRYNDMKERHARQREKGQCFEAEFIVADYTKDRFRDKYKDVDISFGMVSCQFAFHYCFESLLQAKQMIRNVSENLEPGGYFIGTIPDAYDIMKKLEESPNNEFGNEIYSVKFSSEDKKLPLFGAQYDFQLEGVVNCPEFLVYFPTFVKLAEDYGNLELVFCQRFDECFEKWSDTHEGQALLTRMQALETYPPLHGSKLMGPDEKYFVAQEKLTELKKQKQDDTEEPEMRMMGTLSQPEWEVACMYLAFAFRKKAPKDKKEDTEDKKEDTEDKKEDTEGKKEDTEDKKEDTEDKKEDTEDSNEAAG